MSKPIVKGTRRCISKIPLQFRKEILTAWYVVITLHRDLYILELVYYNSLLWSRLVGIYMTGQLLEVFWNELSMTFLFITLKFYIASTLIYLKR